MAVEAQGLSERGSRSRHHHGAGQDQREKVGVCASGEPERRRTPDSIHPSPAACGSRYGALAGAPAAAPPLPHGPGGTLSLSTRERTPGPGLADAVPDPGLADCDRLSVVLSSCQWQPETARFWQLKTALWNSRSERAHQATRRVHGVPHDPELRIQRAVGVQSDPRRDRRRTKPGTHVKLQRNMNINRVM